MVKNTINKILFVVLLSLLVFIIKWPLLQILKIKIHKTYFWKQDQNDDNNSYLITPTIIQEQTECNKNTDVEQDLSDIPSEQEEDSQSNVIEA